LETENATRKNQIKRSSEKVGKRADRGLELLRRRDRIRAAGSDDPIGRQTIA
jgi:hypothetical protein